LSYMNGWGGRLCRFDRVLCIILMRFCCSYMQQL